MGYFCVHQSAIRALAWVRVPDRHGNGPTVIASGGYDGLQCLTDIRDLGGHVFNRTRGGPLTRLALKQSPDACLQMQSIASHILHI